jgi:hypothetical protein
LLEPVEKYLIRRAESGAREVLLVTLNDRLPSKSEQQQLRAAIRHMADAYEWIEQQLLGSVAAAGWAAEGPDIVGHQTED